MKYQDSFKHLKNDKLLGVIAKRVNYLGTSSNITMSNPDEVLSGLGKGIDVFYPILKDAHVKGVIQARKFGTMSQEWSIGNRDQPSPELDFIDAVFSNLKVDKIISDMLDGFIFGYKILEILYLPASEIVGPDNNFEGDFLMPISLEGKPPHWFSFNEHHNALYIQEYTNTALDEQKFIVVRTENDGDNPFGRGVLSLCYWPWMIKKEATKYWVQFSERYGVPFLIGKYDADIKKNTQEAVDEFLENIVSGGYGAMPKDVETQLIDATSGSSDIFKSLINWCNSEISKAVLSQTLTTEAGTSGSYALGQVHEETRNQIIEGDSRMVQEAMNKLIKIILDLNFVNPQNYPKFTFSERFDEAKEIEKAVKLSSTGQIRFTDKFFNKIGYDSEDFQIVEQSYMPPTQFSEEDKENTFIEEFQKMGEPAIELIKNAKSYKEIKDKLFDTFDEMDDEEFQKVFSEALIEERLKGMQDGI
jgi:phage gp29-like protein